MALIARLQQFRVILVLVFLIALVGVGCAVFWQTLLKEQSIAPPDTWRRGEFRVRRLNQAASRQVDANLRSTEVALKELSQACGNDSARFGVTVAAVLASFPRGRHGFAAIIGADGHVDPLFRLRNRGGGYRNSARFPMFVNVVSICAVMENSSRFIHEGKRNS